MQTSRLQYQSKITDEICINISDLKFSSALELNHITSLLINFEPLRCVVYWKTVLKKGGAYFKVIGVILTKFQGFIIMSF